MTSLERWKYAIKPASWPKLLVPFFCAQCIAMGIGEYSWWVALICLLFVVADGCFIVLMNDWGDARVDSIKRRMYPDGCSPKTIPDGILPSRQVLLAALIFGALVISIGVAVQVLLNRPYAGMLAVSGVALFAAYSLPPIQLNYRGGGELLEAIGVGWALPWFCVYAQTDVLWSPLWLAFAAGALPFALSSALASGLADEVSDQRGGKSTFVTLYGNEAVCGVVCKLPIVGAMVWFVSVMFCIGFERAWLFAPIVGFVVARNEPLRELSALAQTDAFKEISAFKRELHRTGWIANLSAAAAFMVAWCF